MKANRLGLHIEMTSKFFKEYQKRGALSRTGVKFSKATRARMSKARMGMKYKKSKKKLQRG
jgi:hypothetical protein